MDIEDMYTEPAPEELSEEFADGLLAPSADSVAARSATQPNGELRNGYADDPVELGRRVREARKAKGWTQGELAAAAGTHGPIISQIENGKLGKVGKATLQRVAAAVLTS
jgi:ribosome-binding protein aMBF1 (putative translation factor)